MKICVKNKGENKINKQNDLTSAQQTTKQHESAETNNKPLFDFHFHSTLPLYTKLDWNSPFSTTTTSSTDYLKPCKYIKPQSYYIYKRRRLNFNLIFSYNLFCSTRQFISIIFPKFVQIVNVLIRFREAAHLTLVAPALLNLPSHWFLLRLRQHCFRLLLVNFLRTI